LRITGLSTIEMAEWMRIQPLAELRMKIPSLQDMIDLYGYSMELTLEAPRIKFRNPCRANSVIDALIGTVQNLAARAIHSATYTRYLDRYNLARNLGIGEETLEDMEIHWNNLAISIQGDLQVIGNSLNESMQTLREVSRLNMYLDA